MTEVIFWTMVIGFLANVAMNRLFGQEWPRLLGDSIRAWWASRQQ